MLDNDTFIVDAGCRAALLQATQAVFSRLVCGSFLSRGPPAGAPATLSAVFHTWRSSPSRCDSTRRCVRPR